MNNRPKVAEWKQQLRLKCTTLRIKIRKADFACCWLLLSCASAVWRHHAEILNHRFKVGCMQKYACRLCKQNLPRIFCPLIKRQQYGMPAVKIYTTCANDNYSEYIEQLNVNSKPKQWFAHSSQTVKHLHILPKTRFNLGVKM